MSVHAVDLVVQLIDGVLGSVKLVLLRQGGQATGIQHIQIVVPRLGGLRARQSALRVSGRQQRRARWLYFCQARQPTDHVLGTALLGSQLVVAFLQRCPVSTSGLHDGPTCVTR